MAEQNGSDGSGSSGRSGHTQLMGMQLPKAAAAPARSIAEPTRGGATLALHALPSAPPSSSASPHESGTRRSRIQRRPSGVDALTAGRGSSPSIPAVRAHSETVLRTPSSPPVARRSGDVVADRYELLDLLGEGSMARVFRARDRRDDSMVALKIMRASLAHDETLKQRMRHEAQLTGSIISDHVVEILDLGQLPDESCYFAMELLEGETLADMLLGPLTAYTTLINIGCQVAEALATAHRKDIVHRDLKPENIFVTYTEDGEVNAKVLDFGVAKHITSQPLTQPGTVLGTPHYLAPEQALAGAVVDRRSDIYAMGAILFELATGAPPFDGPDMMSLVMAHLTEPAPDLSALRPDIPKQLSAVIARCLAKKPEDRYDSGCDLVAALRACEVDVAGGVGNDKGVTLAALYSSSPPPSSGNAIFDTRAEATTDAVAPKASPPAAITATANTPRLTPTSARQVMLWSMGVVVVSLLTWLLLH